MGRAAPRSLVPSLACVGHNNRWSAASSQVSKLAFQAHSENQQPALKWDFLSGLEDFKIWRASSIRLHL